MYYLFTVLAVIVLLVVDLAFLTEMDVLVTQPSLRDYSLEDGMPPRTVPIKALHFEVVKLF